jgi:predicted ATP-grasp superfamily ATP-dependent carboligase
MQIQWRLSHDEPVAPSRGRPGARWTHALRDLVSAVQLMRRGRLSLREHWAASRPSVFTVFAAFAIDDRCPESSICRFLFRGLFGGAGSVARDFVGERCIANSKRRAALC